MLDPSRKTIRPLICSGGQLMAILFLFLLAVAACQSGPSRPAGKITGLKPALKLTDPAAANLRPGLAVEYSNIIANSITDLEIAGRGRPGKTLPHLNWPNTSGAVLTSDHQVQVSARIAGYIRFAKAGSYNIKILANDGVRLSLADTLVVEDPGVHGDRFTDTATLSITQAGWYKLWLLYFQKSGSASLQVYWRTPGAAKFEIVPAKALAHSAR